MTDEKIAEIEWKLNNISLNEPLIGYNKNNEMKTINEKEEAVKPAYEKVSCHLTEVETQGLFCVSDSGSGSLFGGLGPYTGSAL